MENQSPETPPNNPTPPPLNNNPMPEDTSINEIGLPTPVQSKFQFKSSIIWIVLIIIIIGLFFAGYGIGGSSENNQIKSLQDQIEKLETNKDKSNNQIAELEKAVKDLDLGIIHIPFKNFKHSYQFSYPSDLILIDYSNNAAIPIFGLEKNNNTIAVIKSGLSEYPIDKYMGQESSKSLKIGKQEATEHIFPEGTVIDGNKSDPFIAYRIINNKVQYVLEFYGNTELSDIQNRILESFKFIKVIKPSSNVFGF